MRSPAGWRAQECDLAAGSAGTDALPHRRRRRGAPTELAWSSPSLHSNVRPVDSAKGLVVSVKATCAGWPTGDAPFANPAPTIFISSARLQASWLPTQGTLGAQLPIGAFLD